MSEIDMKKAYAKDRDLYESEREARIRADEVRRQQSEAHKASNVEMTLNRPKVFLTGSAQAGAANDKGDLRASTVEKRLQETLSILDTLEFHLGKQVAVLTGLDPMAAEREKSMNAVPSAAIPGFIERIDEGLKEILRIAARLERQNAALGGALS